MRDFFAGLARAEATSFAVKAFALYFVAFFENSYMAFKAWDF